MKTKKQNSEKILAEILGALSGDGFIGNYGDRKQQFIIQFTGHRLDDIEYFKYLKQNMLEIWPVLRIIFRSKNNTLRMTTYSKELFNSLINKYNFPVGKKEDKLEIPKKFTNNESLVRAFIRGLFDTDGCLFLDKRKRYKKPYPRLQLELTSNKLFKEVESYLSKYFRVSSKKRLRYGKYTIYSLEIYGHKQLQKWIEIIGFSNKKHIKKVPL